MLKKVIKKSRKQSKEVIEQPKLLYKKDGLFTFPNGDSYEGEFAVDLKSKQIFRHGNGSYLCKDSQLYEARWDHDKMVASVVISNKGGSRYVGTVTSAPEYQTGCYTFPDGSKLKGNFDPNAITELNEVIFYDPNGRKWDHKISEDKSKIILKYNWLNADEADVCKDPESDGEEE